MTNRPDFLIGREPAGLIPTAAGSAQEPKSVSFLLAGLRSMLELRQSRLKSLSVRIWRALKEAKANTDTISEGQTSRYLRQAKTYKFDAVITILKCAPNIVNATADPEVTADLQRRMIYGSMRLATPKYKQGTKARVIRLLRRLKKTDPVSFCVRTTRPGTAEKNYQPLKELRDSPKLLESGISNAAATSLEVVYAVDLGGKLHERKVIVDESENALPHFYQRAGQLLKAPDPQPPKT